MGRDRTASTEAKPFRLFLAADVPEDVRTDLDALLRTFRDHVPVARWTQPSGWHVTLKFLGKTWPRLLEAVAEAAEAVARDSPSFESALTEIGAFPSERRARVVWAGLADPQERFARMVTRLDDLLGEYFVPETREHTPHLTVARLSPSRDLSEFASGMVGTAVASRSFAVDELVLYRSHLSPKGATYEVLGRWALGG